MPISPTFNERVYPIRGSIRFEVDDIESLVGERYSDPVKIGRCEWRLNVKLSEEKDAPKYLKAYLKRMTTSDVWGRNYFEYSRILINQTKSGKDVFNESSDSESYKLIEWSKLLSDGFVKDGKIIVVYNIVINSEDVKRRRFLNEERPNEMDLKDIFGVKVHRVSVSTSESTNSQNPSGVEIFEEEFVVSKISEEKVFSDPFTVFGLPVKIGIQKENRAGDDYMYVSVHLNYDDESDWWQVLVLGEVTIVNQTDMEQSFSKSCFKTYRKSNNCRWVSPIKWSKLVDPANDFVKDGKLKIRTSIQLLEMLGFDENTRRGIDRPMRKMTDAVLTVDDEKLHVCKKILAQQSSYFKNLFSSNPEKLEFDFEDVHVGGFGRLLQLIGDADTDVHVEYADDVLNLIETYKAPECYERIDSVLKNQFASTWMNVLKLMEMVDKYPLPMLRNKFLLELRDEQLLKFITYSYQYKHLSDKMKVAILEWKLVPEESRTESVEPTSYQFSTDFDEESDLTDIKINVNDYSYYASKQILANSSIFFLKKFYGPYSEDTPEVTVFDVSPREFEKLLTHIYHPTRPVTSANIDALLQLAHHFSVPRLMDKCEEYLVLSDNIPLIDKLEYAGNFELPYLLESCLKFARNVEKMKEVKEHYKFQHLSTKVLWELVKRESE